MSVIVSPKAAEDLGEIYRYIAADNPAAADRVLVRLLEVIDLLAEGNVDGREVKLRSGQSVRVWPVPPYRMYYQRTARDLMVVRVYHQAHRSIEK